MHEYEQANFKTLSPYQHQDKYLTDLNFEPEAPSQERQRLTRGVLIWRSVLFAYTRGKLSKDSDKLIVISAIARELQPLMRCRYLAGLWEADLVFQLAWCSCDHLPPSMVYRAPSWSWASIDGNVKISDKNHYFSGDTLIEILEVVIDLVGKDEFGKVQGGHLNLLGNTIYHEVLEGEEKSGLYKIFLNGEVNSGIRLEIDDNMGTKTSTNRLCCLPLHLYFDQRRLYLSGLVLKCVDVTKNEYRRVGLFEYFNIIPIETGHIGKVSIEDPFLSTLGDIEQTECGEGTQYGSLVFKKESANLQEITII